MNNRYLPFVATAALVLSDAGWAQDRLQPDSIQPIQNRLSLQDRVDIDTTDSGWQPLFKSATVAPGADFVFEVPVTITNPPRAVRIPSDGLEKLTTPDQVIVTCGIGPEYAPDDVTQSLASAGTSKFSSAFRAGAGDLDLSSLVTTTAMPLSSFTGGATQIVKLGLDIPEQLGGRQFPSEGLPWTCGMTLWSSNQSAACPGGLCALPLGRPITTYEPPVSSPADLLASGVLPALQ